MTSVFPRPKIIEQLKAYLMWIYCSIFGSTSFLLHEQICRMNFHAFKILPHQHYAIITLHTSNIPWKQTFHRLNFHLFMVYSRGIQISTVTIRQKQPISLLLFSFARYITCSTCLIHKLAISTIACFYFNNVAPLQSIQPSEQAQTPHIFELGHNKYLGLSTQFSMLLHWYSPCPYAGCVALCFSIIVMANHTINGFYQSALFCCTFAYGPGSLSLILVFPYHFVDVNIRWMKNTLAIHRTNGI